MSDKNDDPKPKHNEDLGLSLSPAETEEAEEAFDRGAERRRAEKKAREAESPPLAG